MAFGLAFASGFLFGAPGHVQGNRWVGVLISAIFALIGGGIIYAGIYGNRKLEEQAAVEESNPQSPWLWRKDWAASRAESRNRNSAIGLWVAAIFVNAIVFTLAVSRRASTLAHLRPQSLLRACLLCSWSHSGGRGHTGQYPPKTLWPNLFRVRLAALFSRRER